MSTDHLKTCYRCEKFLRGTMVDTADLLGGYFGCCDDCRIRIQAVAEAIANAREVKK